MDNYVITIARGFGSGGRDIGMALADELGIQCYENRIPMLAAEYSGYDEKLFQQEDEHLRGSVILNKLAKLTQRRVLHPEENQFTSNEKLFRIQEGIIKHLAETESCVIIGKCADHILREYDNVISIYVEAPRYFCQHRVCNSLGVSADEAAHMIEKTDRYRAAYYKFYSGGNYWTNPVNYDMTINTARVGQVDDMSNCVELIKNYMKIRFGEDVLDKIKQNQE